MIYLSFQYITSLLGNKENATSNHHTSIKRVARTLNNEIEETLSKEKSDDEVLGEKPLTQALKKWTVCKTTPFFHCYHITEKSLKIRLGNELGIGKDWLLLKRHFTK